MGYHILLAQVYGSGNYSSYIYGSSTSPQSTLPSTGGGLWAAISVVLIIFGVYMIIWAYRRRRRVQPDVQ